MTATKPIGERIDYLMRNGSSMDYPLIEAKAIIRTFQAAAQSRDELIERLVKLHNLLTPPDGYRIYTMDSSIENRTRITFMLNKKNKEDWHLQGEVLDNIGKDIRQELYVSRVYEGDISALLEARTKGYGHD